MAWLGLALTQLEVDLNKMGIGSLISWELVYENLGMVVDQSGKECEYLGEECTVCLDWDGCFLIC